ncbi:MAG: exosortase F system-associated protein [Flavobacterium sp.]|nr:MAG: exosortase F system-associated protein [Flavobacterium sp.]
MPILQSRSSRIAAFIFLVLALAAVRAFEDELFYDPLLVYFKSDFTNTPIPSLDETKLFAHLAFRYGLNSMLSLAVLYVLFRDRELVRFSAVVYFVFFLLLVASFFCTLHFGPENKLVLFYIRRFLIQPILLLLFIPAFYFQERIKKS